MAHEFDVKTELPEAFHFDLLILSFRSVNKGIKHQLLCQQPLIRQACGQSQDVGVPAEVVVHLDVEAVPVRLSGHIV